MNTNRFSTKAILLLVALLSISSLTVQGKNKMKKPVPFYDSKSWIVNIAGDTQDPYFDLKSKFNKINMPVPTLGDFISDESKGREIAEQFTKQGLGKKMIDVITANGTSDEYLKQMALNNAQRADFELGAASIRANGADGLSTIVADDYEPILTHNYIIAYHPYEWKDKDGKSHEGRQYSIFKVDIDPQTAFDIVASIQNPEMYNSIAAPVQYLYTIGGTDELENQLAVYVPDMALRGVLLHRSPAKISIGSNAGLKKGDLVSFYSQQMDKNGKLYSKRISRARVCGLWDDEAQVNFEAGLRGNRKNGDVVVRTPDSHVRFAIEANWQPHVWGGSVIADGKCGFTRSGLITHFLMNLSYAMTDKPGNTYYKVSDVYGNNVVDTDTKYLAPMYFNAGLGFGVSKTFLGFYDVMPYFIAQWDGALMVGSQTEKGVGAENAKSILGNAVRVPVGLRFSVNLGYPTRLYIEAGYAFRFGFGDDYKYVKDAEKYIGAKRQGIFLNLGFVF